MPEAVWVEKYRPERLEDMVGQEEVVARLRGYVESGNMPNLLFAGPPGTGKTTAALALAKEMFGSRWKANFLELNASDERGIDVVRGKIKNFARTKAIGDSFKIIFLDEADALTKDAQHALRRTMEMYTTTCRFILSCNYSSKIIEPIQSRCALFRFRPLKDEDITKVLRRIAMKEGLDVTKDGVEAIIYSCEGDLRKAINVLQSCAAYGKEIDAELVHRVVGRARPQEIREILLMAMKGDFLSAREKLRELMITYGMSGEDVVAQIHRETFNLPISERKKVELVDTIGEYDFRIKEGASELIQLEALVAQFVGAGGEGGA